MTTQPPRLAVIEDDNTLRDDLVEFLGLRGFAVRGFESAEAFYQAWPTCHFDLLVLDIILPHGNGFDVVHLVRSHKEQVGIVMLTALGEDAHQIKGLNVGADAYLVKGCSLEVIEATCHSVLRRLALAQPASAPPTGQEANGTNGGWMLHTRRWQLQAPDGAVIDLTHAELGILTLLFEYAGQPIEREVLLARLGKADTLSNLRNLDNCASRLRRKVAKIHEPGLPIRPCYGRGYAFLGEGSINTK